MVIAQCPLREPKLSAELPNQLLHDVLFENAPTFPANRIALIDPQPISGKQAWTYEELQTHAFGVAHELRGRHGMREGDVIGSYMENRCELVVAIIGALAAGGTYTGVNQQYTPHELGRQFKDADVRFVITRTDLLSNLTKAINQYKLHVNTIFVLDFDTINSRNMRSLCTETRVQVFSLKALTSAKADAKPHTNLNPRSIAFMPYSSGTTGTPKGVLQTHSAMSCFRDGYRLSTQGGIRDTGIITAPLFHMAGFLGFTSNLHNGCTLIILPRYSPSTFAEMIDRYKVTLILGVPALFVALVKEVAISHCTFDSVEKIRFGTAPAGPELLGKLRSRMKNLKTLSQVYGMSEACVLAVMPVMDLDRLPLKSAGVPVPGCKIKIMTTDAKPKELGTNQTGEIWASAPGSIMVSYHNRPQQTAECITKDGWLRTGDVGFLDNAGYLYIVDRLKELIKYKGYQISPAELEDVLLKHPAVREAAVVGLPGGDIGELATAFVVVKQGCESSEHLAREIATHAAKHIAPYKQLRGGVRFVESLPKTPAGKIMRRLLKQQVAELKAKL